MDCKRHKQRYKLQEEGGREKEEHVVLIYGPNTKGTDVFSRPPIDRQYIHFLVMNRQSLQSNPANG